MIYLIHNTWVCLVTYDWVFHQYPLPCPSKDRSGTVVWSLGGRSLKQWPKHWGNIHLPSPSWDFQAAWNVHNLSYHLSSIPTNLIPPSDLMPYVTSCNFTTWESIRPFCPGKLVVSLSWLSFLIRDLLTLVEQTTPVEYCGILIPLKSCLWQVSS